MQAERIEHLDMIVNEQSSYAGRVNNAIQFPQSYISLTIDGMERTPVPYHLPFIKSWIGKRKRYGLQVFGVMDHGHRNAIYYYPGHIYHKGANAIISILYAHLLQYINQPEHPPILYLQADNCWGENKNKTVLAFLSFLVAIWANHHKLPWMKTFIQTWFLSSLYNVESLIVCFF